MKPAKTVFFPMAKSAQSTKFRGVDIDELDENKFQDEGEEDSGQSGPDEAEVNNLLLQYPCTDDCRLSVFIRVLTSLILKTGVKTNYCMRYLCQDWSCILFLFPLTYDPSFIEHFSLSVKRFMFSLDSEGRGLFYAIWP